MARTIFIGDVHGCIDELDLLIEKLKVTPSDRVILLGDLINRGPDSLSVLRYVYNRGFECLMGNHDYEYFLHFDSILGEHDFYRELHSNLSRDIHDWYIALPFYLKSRKFIAVHAGLAPGKKLQETDPHILMNIRTWDGQGLDLRCVDAPAWHLLYKGSIPVFYGHWAKQGLHRTPNTYGLDTGCVYGGKLSSYILEEKQVVQVRAKRAYYP